MITLSTRVGEVSVSAKNIAGRDVVYTTICLDTGVTIVLPLRPHEAGQLSDALKMASFEPGKVVTA